MARFGQGLMSSLANPAYLGQVGAIGQTAGGMFGNAAAAQEQRKAQAATNELMGRAKEAMAAGDVNALQTIAAQLSRAGNEEQAMQIAQAAEKIAGEKAGAGSEKAQQRTRQAISQMYQGYQVARPDMKPKIRARIQGLAMDQGIDISGLQFDDETATRERPRPISASPGTQIINPETGEVMHSVPFKPPAPPTPDAPKVSFQKLPDGDLGVFKGTDLVQRIAGKEGTASAEAEMEVISKSVFLQSQVDKLMGDVPFTGSGLAGQTLGRIGGTEGYDRDRDIINLKANLGFDQINKMKEQAAAAGASGTGLGQISNIEFMSLQSTVDSLDVGMSAEAQNEALANIKRYLSNIQKLASGIAPEDAVEWNRPEYKAAGYVKDSVSGMVLYYPDGPDGRVLVLENGKFVPAG